MTKEELFEDLKNALDHASKSVFKDTITKYQKSNSVEDTSRDIALFFMENYSSSRADALATYMEVALRQNPNLALVSKQDNPLFRLIALKGSKDLYDCFIEEAIEPYLKKKNEDDTSDYFTSLLMTVITIDDHFFPQFVPCIKGLDYNGAFSVSEDNANVVLINKEDYKLMEDVLEKYNTIIGRRDIIADLEEKE